MKVWVLISYGDGYCECGKGDGTVCGVTSDESVKDAWEARGSWQQAEETTMVGAEVNK